jgi:hypothetical protein
LDCEIEVNQQVILMVIVDNQSIFIKEKKYISIHDAKRDFFLLFFVGYSNKTFPFLSFQTSTSVHT